MSKKDIRPSIPTIINELETSPSERFQNLTMRPILKMQNDLLVQIFKQYIEKRKGVYHQLSIPKRQEYIQKSIQQDLKFKHFLVGTIVGQFTLEEWTLFQEQEKELIRRMTVMIIARLQDQMLVADA